MMHPDVNWSGGRRPLRAVLFHHVFETVMGAAHLQAEGHLSPLLSGVETYFMKPQYCGELAGASTGMEKDKTGASTPASAPV